MFNWFKNKHSNYLPKDINKGLITSNFCTVNLNDNLTIANNIICIVSYKDKIYIELNSGSYNLNKEFLPKVYEKQLKKKKKLKTLNLDLYFINLNQFNYEIEFFTTLYINKKKQKVLFNITTDLQVEKPKVFYKFIINEITGVEAKSCEKLLFDLIEIETVNFFLRKTIKSSNLSTETLQNLQAKINKTFKKIGLKEATFNVTLTPTSKNNVKNSTNSHSLNNDNITNNQLANSIDETNKIEYTQNETNNTLTCPICKTKQINGSLFCHKCGYKFNK